MTAKLKILILSIIISYGAIFAQTPLENATALFDQGRYDEAAPILREVLAKDSRNAKAYYMLGTIELYNYDIDAAQATIERFNKRVKHTDVTRADLDDLQSRLERTEQMLQRVESIVVLDSVIVDADRFLSAYRLSPSSGNLRPMSYLPPQFKGADQGAVYTTEDGDYMIWASPVSKDDDTWQLVASHRLTDGTWESPTPISENFNEGGDNNYPFLMPDGSTIYFAGDGENSLGGYDIFISRDNGDGYLQPQNIGMPYNSPYDDYMLVIDEESGLGWWATDRNRIPGKITIYIFQPSESRRNIDPEAENLAALALMKSIRDTWGDKDYTGVAAKKYHPKAPSSQSSPEFRITIPGRGECTRMADLPSPAAREAMSKYLILTERVNELKSQLNDLRQRYARGDKSVSHNILAIEKQILTNTDEAVKARNEVIRVSSK